MRAYIAGALLLAMAAGCATPKLRVVGDKPADVYVTKKPSGIRETITDVVKEKLDIDSPVRYVGRTTPDPYVPGQYVLRYHFDEYPDNGAAVIVRTQDQAWEYRVDFESRSDKETVWYPKVAAGSDQKPFWDRWLKGGAVAEPREGTPQPASQPK